MAYGGMKLRFESRKSAELFIKYNSNVILDENGFAPVRSYYCEACGCWHVTSQPAKEPLACNIPKEQKLVSEFIPASATLRRESRKLKHQLETCLSDAFQAIKYRQLDLAKSLCNKGLELYSKCLEMAIPGRKKKQLLQRLTFCVDSWQRVRNELLRSLFRVDFKPATLHYHQWYMQ